MQLLEALFGPPVKSWRVFKNFLRFTLQNFVNFDFKIDKTLENSLKTKIIIKKVQKQPSGGAHGKFKGR